jgi:8-oxo-dGTP pyrophosphatase MutT (NUDIX family)
MNRPIGDDLRTLLAGHAPFDGNEKEAVDAVLALLDRSDAFSAGLFAPGHITASAFVLHPTEPAVALILHSKIGRWLQPGGHVEPEDDSITDAALREVREEIGLGPSGRPWLCDVDIHVFPARDDVPRHLHHDVRIAFTADSVELVVGDGADDVRWWPLPAALLLEESVARPARKLSHRLRLAN